MSVFVCRRVQAISLWLCIWLFCLIWSCYTRTYWARILLPGLTEVLTVYFSVEPGEDKMSGLVESVSQWRIWSWRKGCQHTLGDDHGTDEKGCQAHIWRWPWSRRKGCHYTVEEVSSKLEEMKSTVWGCSTFLESIHCSAVGCDSLTAVHIIS